MWLMLLNKSRVEKDNVIHLGLLDSVPCMVRVNCSVPTTNIHMFLHI